MKGKANVTLSLLFILLFMLLGTGYVHGAVPQEEREALIALYNSTNGDNWKNNSNWKTNGDFSAPGTENTWYGVTCNEWNTAVWGINLMDNNLDGTIPAELGNLSELDTLDLSANQLTGSIPPELGNLFYLWNLYLESNQLTGSIPPELGDIPDLEVLSLYSNQLTGSIPPELGNLFYLRYLYLDSNQLTGNIPPALGNLSELSVLWLSSNQLEGSIPKELGNLSNLQYLYLYSNRLDSIPKELGQLNNLKKLYLNSNQMESIPKELGGLSKLITLDLSSNELGSIPKELGGLSELITLDISSNELGSIPKELGELSKLEALDLSSNQLGSIPKELGELSKLEALDLSSNQLNSIPEELRYLERLVTLDLSSNHLGSIPPELGELYFLETFNLSNNQLDSIPPELGNLIDNLETLDLSSNRLTDFPPELSRLSALEVLDLSSNGLKSIPPELGELSSLETLDLSSNELGSIPSELGYLQSLETLDLSSNQLNSIPEELGYLKRLVTLDLSANHLTGIPPELANLKKLSILYLNSNRFDLDGLSNITSFTGLDDNKSDFRWNLLYTDDESVRTFLNKKQVGGEWEDTQTAAPTNVSARTISPFSVEVSWKPIAYFSDTGGYMVYYSRTPGGPYDDWQAAGITGRKTDSRLEVKGLQPLTTYYFVVKTQTENHPNNPNTLESEYSAEVSSDTPGSDKIISGRVTTETGEGVEGVTLIFIPSESTEEKAVVITNAEGYYSYTVKYGWWGRVETSKPGFSITPVNHTGKYENITSDQANQDYTAIPYEFSISGKVTSRGEGEGVEGVTMTFTSSSGETETEVTTADGSYDHPVPYGWIGTVTPSKNNLLFSPPSITYEDPGGVASNQRFQDYELSISLLLNVSRIRDRTLILKKEYGKIELTVNVDKERNPPPDVQKFVISRKEPGGIYQAIIEFNPTQGNAFTFDDKYLDKDKTYTYIARALDANGNVIGESKEKTIQPL